MGRVKSVLVIGVLTVAASAVVAGPAVAAKGGNSDNAHACQQGGHENRFEAETGNPFKNAGDCVSHGAQGGESSTLQFVALPTYPCPTDERETCWGVVSGSNLSPGSLWAVLDLSEGGAPTTTGHVLADGSLPSTNANVRCGRLREGQLQAVTAGGTTVVLNRDTPC